MVTHHVGRLPVPARAEATGVEGWPATIVQTGLGRRGTSHPVGHHAGMGAVVRKELRMEQGVTRIVGGCDMLRGLWCSLCHF